MFARKKILLGVTAGIAAYKSCEIIRELVENNAKVKVTMTDAALYFVSPLTFETLSGNPVFYEQFEQSTIHIDLARWADCILICPATFNTVNKVAIGIADNLLTTLISAVNVPVIFCPAMNKEMYANPIFQANVRRLKELGYHFVDAAQGKLACNEEGWGRLAEKNDIINTLKRVLLGSDELQGKTVIVTAGRTEEPLDPVRILTNYSSGKMGFALAEEAALRGAKVTLISGPNNLSRFPGIEHHQIQTAAQMAELVFSCYQSADIIIMAAAVADCRPKFYSKNKLKKSNDRLAVEFEPTVDILYKLGQDKKHQVLVGFAVETEQGVKNAIRKLEQKNLDFIVLNNPLDEGAAFAGDTNRVSIIDREGDVEKLSLMPKSQVARKVIDKVIKIIHGNQ